MRTPEGIIQPAQNEEEEQFWQKAFLAAFQALIALGRIFREDLGRYARGYADIALEEFRNRHDVHWPLREDPDTCPKLKDDVEHDLTNFTGTEA